MVTPIVDPVVETSVTPALYPVPSGAVGAGPGSCVGGLSSAAGGGSPVRDQSLSCLVSPPGSVSEPMPSQISPSLRSEDVARPPSGMAPMDQYLPRDALLLLGESMDSPFLPAPLTPRRIIEELVSGSVVVSLTGEPVAGAPPSMPYLSREGPFNVHRDYSKSGASPRALDSMRGCQYHMISHDEENGGPDFNPAYGIHLHDPRLLEYVDASESVPLLSRSPKYWLHHMGREKMLSAALQLQHDTGLILSNIQVLHQFVTSLNRMSSTGSRFRRIRCRMWRRLIVFDGRHITWLPWDCGVHLVRRGFMAPCRRRRATPACLVLTVFQIYHSSSV